MLGIQGTGKTTTYPGTIEKLEMSSWESSDLSSSFVDRDMLMRYEWGLGVGHTYSWKNTLPHRQAANRPSADLVPEEPEEQEPNADSNMQCAGAEDDAAFCLDDRENELLSDGESHEGDWADEEVSDEEAYLDMIDMYGD